MDALTVVAAIVFFSGSVFLIIAMLRSIVLSSTKRSSSYVGPCPRCDHSDFQLCESTLVRNEKGVAMFRTKLYRCDHRSFTESYDFQI